MPGHPLKKKLYESVKSEAKQIFKKWPSLYASAWLSKEYKRRGGTYSSSPMQIKKSYTKKSPTKRSRSRSPSTATIGVNRWFREEWIQVLPYVKYGKKVACGSKKDAPKACRPLKRITDQTPITIPELVKIHGKEKLLNMAQKKINDMNGRLYWKSGTFKSSVSSPKTVEKRKRKSNKNDSSPKILF
tara:strand:- start:1907 stop:2467 length:561 start_codon:yes stop_codon:yes gene_type:complete